MRKENLKRPMLTNRSKEEKEEDVFHDYIHEKELEMKLFDVKENRYKKSN